MSFEEFREPWAQCSCGLAPLKRPSLELGGYVYHVPLNSDPFYNAGWLVSGDTSAL